MPFFIGGGDYERAGVIKMWHGTIATIPAGYALCNGANGTPDLRNKFIVCANADDAGTAKSTITGAALQTGGSNTHSHGLTGGAPNLATGGDDSILSTTSEANIPAFYALAFIMKL